MKIEGHEIQKKYPYFGKGRNKYIKEIVMFVSKNCGILVKEGVICGRVGLYSNIWDENSFEPISYTATFTSD